MIDKDFFNQYQKQFVWVANTWLGRWFFKIEKMGHSLEYGRIDAIYPNAIRHFRGFVYVKEGKRHRLRPQFTMQFFTRPTYALRLNSFFAWIPFNAVKRVQYDGQWYLQPKFGLSTLTVYPDAHVETNSVDGMVYRNAVDETFSTIRGGTGSGAIDNAVALSSPYLSASTTTNQFYQINRSCYGFLTSSLGSSATISAATFSLYADGNINQGLGDVGMGVVSFTPASNTALASGDYAITNFGSTDFATRINVSTFGTAGYKDYTLNASGLAYINKTGVTNFGHLLGWDIDNNFTGTWSSGAVTNGRNYFAEQTGTANDPKLVITYTSSSAYTLTAACASFTLTGIAINLLKALKIIAATASYTLTGIAVNLLRGLKMVSTTAVYNLTGVATNFTKALRMTANVSAYTLSGISSAFKVAYKMTATTVNFILTGITISIRKSGWNDKYSNKGSVFSDKFSNRGTSSANKYSARGNSWSDKY